MISSSAMRSVSSRWAVNNSEAFPTDRDLARAFSYYGDCRPWVRRKHRLRGPGTRSLKAPAPLRARSGWQGVILSLRVNPCPRGSQVKRGHAPCPATRNPRLGEEFIFAGRVASPRFPSPGLLGAWVVARPVPPNFESDGKMGRLRPLRLSPCSRGGFPLSEERKNAPE